MLGNRPPVDTSGSVIGIWRGFKNQISNETDQNISYGIWLLAGVFIPPPSPGEKTVQAWGEKNDFLLAQNKRDKKKVKNWKEKKMEGRKK